MSNTPKKHHYLPQHHLSRFIKNSEKNNVIVYDKKLQKIYPATVKNTGCENHLYSLSGENNDTRDSSTVENNLAQIDGLAASCLNIICKKEVLPQDHMNSFLSYLATLILRTPYSIQRNIDMITPTMQEMCERMLKSDKVLRSNLMKELCIRDEDFNALIKKLVSGRMKVSPNKEVAMLMNMENIQVVRKALTNYSLTYFECPDDLEFCICDNPLFVCDPYTNRKMNIGIGSKLVEITVPISKTLCLVGVPSVNSTQKFQLASSDQVAEINYRTSVAANRFVYGSVRNDTLAKQVFALVDSAPACTTTKYKPEDKLYHILNMKYPVVGFTPILKLIV